MKVFLRALVILLAALIVAGSALGISSTSSSANAAQSAIDRPTPPSGERPAGGDHGGQGFSLMGLGSVGMSLVKVSLIVTPFAIAASIQQRRKQGQKFAT